MMQVRPSAEMLILWIGLAACRFLPLVGAQELDCSFQKEPLSLMDGLMTLQHIVNPQERTIAVELVYNDIGWVSFGINPNGRMKGGEVVIAKTAKSLSDTNPGKYIMYGEDKEDISLMDQQTLLDATFEQTDGQTILRFTKLLSEEGELEIDPDISNTFIFAAGSSNDFWYHGELYGRKTLDVLNKCRALNADETVENGNNKTDDDANNEQDVANQEVETEEKDTDTEQASEKEKDDNYENDVNNEEGADTGDDADTEEYGGSSSSSGNVVTPVGNNNNWGNQVVVQGGLDCSFRNEIALMDGGLMTLKHIVNPDEETITVEVTYNTEGWVAFGTSPNGKMVGGEVVIAKTDESPSATNPGKYIMTGESSSNINLMDSQTLMDATFEQANGQTILRYTKFLRESGETEIVAGASNTFIFAAGSENSFGNHGPLRGRITLDSLTKCRAADGSSNTADDSVVVAASQSRSEETLYRNLWAFHGILMGTSWAILLPIGIGCSLLRNLIPGDGLWFRIHMFMNGVAFMLMTAAFGAAVYVINQEGDDHFEGRHQAIGLVVYLLSFLQVVAGIFRPHLPHSPHVNDDNKLQQQSSTKDAETTHEMDGKPDEDTTHNDDRDVSSQESDISSISSLGNNENFSNGTKRLGRTMFEVGHRTVGFSLLGLAWYECYLGIEEMVEYYGNSYDKTAVLWSFVGSLSCAILGLFGVQKWRNHRS